MWRNCLNFTLRSATNLRKLATNVNNYNGWKTAFILTCAAGKLVESADPNLSFLTDLKKACGKNDEALRELMQVLGGCISEISKEYQLNIKMQIDIIDKCTKLGPVGEHWDELTKYRVHATELKEELSKYETLAQKIGQMAYNQAITSLLSGVDNAMNLVEVDYGKLESLVIQLGKDNYQWEAKLLYANRDSILNALK